MLGAKPIETPMKLNLKLFTDKGKLLEDPGHHHRLIGKLICLTIIRLDISFVVGVVR